MRPIKFRFYNKIDKKIYGPFSLQKIGEDGGLVFEEHIYVMQYTGLKDKNGVEIYERDIVKELNVPNVGDDEDPIGDVRFSPSRGYYVKLPAGKYVSMVSYFEDDMIERPMRTRSLRVTAERIEVIGNIYENPELLK